MEQRDPGGGRVGLRGQGTGEAELGLRRQGRRGVVLLVGRGPPLLLLLLLSAAPASSPVIRCVRGGVDLGPPALAAAPRGASAAAAVASVAAVAAAPTLLPSPIVLVVPPPPPSVPPVAVSVSSAPASTIFSLFASPIPGARPRPRRAPAALGRPRTRSAIRKMPRLVGGGVGLPPARLRWWRSGSFSRSRSSRSRSSGVFVGVLPARPPPSGRRGVATRRSHRNLASVPNFFSFSALWRPSSFLRLTYRRCPPPPPPLTTTARDVFSSLFVLSLSLSCTARSLSLFLSLPPLRAWPRARERAPGAPLHLEREREAEKRTELLASLKSESQIAGKLLFCFTCLHPMQRVKVYRLNPEGLWDDKGTGSVSVEYLEV